MKIDAVYYNLFTSMNEVDENGKFIDSQGREWHIDKENLELIK